MPKFRILGETDGKLNSIVLKIGKTDFEASIRKVICFAFQSNFNFVRVISNELNLFIDF